ncbi:hypothetical protein BH23CHL2_BH23CHL2_16770 [soil metagenome]
MTSWMLRHEAATSALTYAEIVEYIRTRPDFAVHHRELRALLREVYPYFPAYGILQRYADIRLRLRPPYGSGLIGDIDTLIAATALDRDLIIVTLDRDFLRVPDLKVTLLDRSTFRIIQEQH